MKSVCKITLVIILSGNINTHRGMIEAKNMGSVSATVMNLVTSVNKQRVKLSMLKPWVLQSVGVNASL